MAEIIILGPVACNPMGAYNSETEYERLDVVFYNNVSYIAKQNVQGQLPTNTDYWDALGISGVEMSNYYPKDDVDDLLDDKEDKSNKVTSISDSSTDKQYASAKCVYDYIEDKIGSIENILEELDIGGGV